MIDKRSFYKGTPGLAKSIEDMLIESINHDIRQDRRVLFHCEQYHIIGKVYREPARKFGKADTILCVVTVKLTEPGFVNLQSPVSKQEFQCKASHKKLKGTKVQDKIAYLVQSVSLDIDYALATRRRNFSPEFIEKLRSLDDN